MHSRTTEKFRSLFDALPKPVQEKARTAYRLWAQNKNHPSLRFKKVHATLPVYSVRIDLGWRAVGILEGDTVVWFWIGSHPEYEELLRKL
ncbi:MAG: hypothetical protein A3F73_08720 [Gallionellales bacterium RIFCSPLOWO2_12_FULL_59_22]|nr:MAG: hypothetical protein A3H99_09765 [Gallionellales bacterium RIFCSPLOWO2_02_FULL_59_110]OGT05294.1 MAG: hypothetical protein A2Z65_13495 [Gallionellales bacterium RIFCSPLOWO2_02_58_13]OGT12891.1 MAG: hypothetical protein A3F73_08720 [Gallionellales bacterium RIFCSPLOWO2_12_FULL_59_22]